MFPFELFIAILLQVYSSKIVCERNAVLPSNGSNFLAANNFVVKMLQIVCRIVSVQMAREKYIIIDSHCIIRRQALVCKILPE